jgi:aminoglycoside phosphotransferase (APT) family kinase protein
MAARMIAPGNARLLHGVRALLKEIAAGGVSDKTLLGLTAADIVLNELMLREDAAAYEAAYVAMRALLDEAVLLLDAKRGAALREQLAGMPMGGGSKIGFSALSGHLWTTFRGAEMLVEAARDAPALDGVVAKMIAAEAAFYQGQVEQAPRPEMLQAAQTPSREALQAYLVQRDEAARPVIKSFTHLVGGFRKTTILFETEDAVRGPQSCVLRAEKAARFLEFCSLDIRDEFKVVGILYDAGLPVAKPLWLESDAAALGNRFMVSARVLGKNYGSATTVNTKMTDEALRRFITTLAKIHLVPVGAALKASAIGYWAAYPTMAENTLGFLEMWRRDFFEGKGNPSPILARIFSWLADNVPPDEEPLRLVHSDYGPHNILVHENQVSGVLDWESPRLGDPAEDVSYFLQCVGAQADRAQALAWYEEAAGYRISEYRLRYFDVFNMIKIIMGSTMAAAMYEGNPDAEIEWCILAFRYIASVAGTVQEKIKLAEACR